jgi:hypothetical protein
MALAIAVALAVLTFVLRQQQQEAVNKLRAIVELELAALANGDRDLFLNQQDPSDQTWRRAQEEAFERYQQQVTPPPWEVTWALLKYSEQAAEVRIEGDQGWALIEIHSGQRTWREFWFYRWSRAGGWHHARLDADWLGEEQQYATPHLRLTYPERDHAIVVGLADEMENWYDTLAPFFGLGPTDATLMTIEFSYRDPARSMTLETGWGRHASRTLLAPSPHLGPFTSESRPSPNLRRKMAGYLAEALIARQARQRPEEPLGLTVDALRDELRDWAVAQLASGPSSQGEWDLPSTPLVNALIARHGVQIIPQLAATLKPGRSLNETLAAAGLAPPDPTTRVAFHLAAVNRAFLNLDEKSFSAQLDPDADRSWRRFYLNRLRNRRETVPAGPLPIAPVSFEVRSIIFNGAVAAVEAETVQDDGSLYNQVYFFRRIDDPPAAERDVGDWLLTSPDPAYFGEQLTTRTENLEILYFERDADWFEGSLPEDLQAILSRAAIDLGISTVGLIFTVDFELEPGLTGFASGDPHRLQFTSPSVAGWPVNGLDDQVVQMGISLIAAMFQDVLQNAPEQNTPEENSRFFFTYIGAFVWELDRLFSEKVDLEAWLGIDTHQVPAISLTELWPAPDSNWSDPELEEIWAVYLSLFKFLSETYGPQVVPALLNNLSQTSDLDEWLRLSTGQGVAELEPAWQSWVQTTYGER